ncbi:MAG: RNA polymerase sigma factor, partial [Deltaproteobacteria bacterium]|nr:RNA polymerase sigma factor [Deltaproteobacteria bacterium]
RAPDPFAPLVARVRDGDLAAFDQLYRRTRQDVHRILYHLVGANADMDDLIQETFIQLLKALRTFRGEARFSTFLYRVCANVSLMHLRSGRRRKEDPVEELPETPAGPTADPERSAQAAQAAQMMSQALERLAPEKRMVFVYHDFLGMKPEEISESLAIPVNTVRSRLGRAREELVGLFAQARGELAVTGGERVAR